MHVLRIWLRRVARARVCFCLFASGIVPFGLLLGDPDSREPGIPLCSRAFEDHVDLFEAPRSSLRVEEVDRGDDDKVDDGVGCVGLVGDQREHHWAGDDDAEVGEPIDGSRLCV